MRKITIKVTEFNEETNKLTSCEKDIALETYSRYLVDPHSIIDDLVDELDKAVERRNS